MLITFSLRRKALGATFLLHERTTSIVARTVTRVQRHFGDESLQAIDDSSTILIKPRKHQNPVFNYCLSQSSSGS